jgi:hypothetical protein
MKTKIKRGLNLKPEERFLFERLPDVLRLEAAMNDIRRKYSEFWDDICRRVQGEHAELNCPCNRATSDYYEQVAMGRDCWPSAYKPWPSGFYILHVNLECFCLPDYEAPCAGIWIRPRKENRIDLESLKKTFPQEAERQLGVNLRSEGNSEISLWFDLPESRDELLGMLTKGKESQFANCMVSHFGRLAKLIPLIDEVFKIKDRRGK